jgi:hypothetical protein
MAPMTIPDAPPRINAARRERGRAVVRSRADNARNS